MTDPAERPGPFARLLGSLANVLIDVGLPAIRQWLRDRLGPGADVADVRADGSVVHLEGVVVPVTTGIELSLARASVTGLPQVRLQSASGVLTFTDLPLRVELAFARGEAEERDEHERGLWADGEVRLVVRRSADAASFAGRARLRASAGEWRLEGGLLENHAGGRITLSAAGGFEPGEPPSEGFAAPLVPAAVRSAAVTLAAVPLAELLALGDRTFPLPLEVTGDVAWDGERGGRVDLDVDGGAGGKLRAAGYVAVHGGGLEARIDGAVRPSALVRAFGAPVAAAPREEDVVRVDLAVRGSVDVPVLEGTLRADELGLRFGRPRFVPATILRNVAADVTATRRAARVRAAAEAQRGALTADVEADLVSAMAHATVRGDVDAAFVRDVLRTLGARIEVPPSLVVSSDLSFTSGRPGFSGRAVLSTDASRMTVEPAGEEAGWRARVTGAVATADVLATGLLAKSSVRPEAGSVTVDLSADREGAHGVASASGLVLAFLFVEAGAEGAPATCTLADASVTLEVDRTRLAYHDLRFHGHGGRFVGEGRIGFVGAPSPVSPLFLRLEEGDSSLARKLFALFAPKIAPAISDHVPSDLRARGTLDLASGGGLAVDLVLETVAGTTLGLAVSLADGAFDGTRLRGALALADVHVAAIRPEGVVALDLALRGSTRRGDLAVAGWLSASRVGLVAEVTDLSARLRADARGILWNPIEATVAGGRVVSVGRTSFGGDVRAQAAIAALRVEDLPPISGRAVGAYVRGRLSAAVRAVRPPGGHPRASGHVRLEGAELPGIALAGSTLERYGLAPPDAAAIGPATAGLTSSEWGVTLGDASLDLRGARVRGSFGISWTGKLDARAEVTLEEDYLRTSSLLALPRVLSERLVVPIHVEGTLASPRLRAEIGGSLGRFLKDNRVTHFVASAVEEAQILLGQTPSPRRSSAAPPPDVAPSDDADLRAELDAHAEDWAEIADRLARG